MKHNNNNNIKYNIILILNIVIMPHELKADNEIDALHLSTHFYETIDSIGGIYGIGVLVFGIFLFYMYVEYTITNGRKKREEKKKLRKQSEQKST